MECVICKGERFRKLILINEVSRYTKKAYPLYKCLDCGLIRPVPLPYGEENKLDIYDESENIKFYNKESNRIEDKSKEYLYYFKHFTPFLELVRKYKIKGRALDVGCGVGHLMITLKKEGLKVEGSEITKKLALALKGKFKVYTESLKTLARKGKRYELVSANQVLEHVENPREFVREIGALLKEKGYFIFAVPYVYGLIPKILRTKWYGLGYGQHLNFFSIKSITLLLEQEGFEVCETKVLSVDYAHPGFPKVLNMIAEVIMKMNVKLGLGDNLFVVARKRGKNGN